MALPSIDGVSFVAVAIEETTVLPKASEEAIGTLDLIKGEIVVLNAADAPAERIAEIEAALTYIVKCRDGLILILRNGRIEPIPTGLLHCSEGRIC